MAFTLEDKLVVAISSRALFDFEEENEVYEAGELREYEALQRSRTRDGRRDAHHAGVHAHTRINVALMLL